MSFDASYVYLAGDSQPFLVAIARREVLALVEQALDCDGRWVSVPSVAGEEEDPKVTRATIRASQITAVTEPIFTTESAAEIGMAVADAKRAHPDWFADAAVVR